MMKRIASIVLALTILCSCAAYAAEEEPVIEEIAAETEEPAAEELSEEIILTDGNAEAEDGVAVMEEAPVKEAVRSASGSYSFPRPYGYGNAVADYHYEDEYFAGSSGVYDHALARMSLAVSQAANEVLDFVWDDAPAYTFLTEETDGLDTPAVNAVRLLTECGFEDLMLNRDYLISTAYDGVNNDGSGLGVLVARKELDSGVTLLAVAVRGGGYGCEWVGNFDMYRAGGSLNHVGFEKASRRITDALEQYVSALAIEGRAKLWLSGYSRGAAAVNLAAASICRSGIAGCEIAPEDVFAYTFETPMATKDAYAEDAIYSGIWNIISMTDPVTYVLPRYWGNTRYGNTLYLPCRWQNTEVFDAYAPAVLAEFNRLRGESFSEIPQVPVQTWFLKNTFDELADSLGGEDTTKTYLFQRTVQSYLKRSYSGKTTADSGDFGLSIFKTMLSAAGLAMLPDGYSDQLKTVLYGHYPELCLAWMETIPADALSYSGTLTYVTLRGSLSQAVVYDDSGNEALTIKNGAVSRSEGTALDAAAASEGKWIICVPEGESARIELKADGRGTVSVSLDSCVFPENDAVDSASCPGISVRRGDTITTVISDAAYSISKNDIQLLPVGEESPGVVISEDGRTVSFTGDTTGLYVRAALALEGASGSGLYVTQVQIGRDGTTDLSAMQFPGLTVVGVNVALVRSIQDITSPTPDAVAMDTRML